MAKLVEISQNIDNTISSVSGDTERIRKVIDEVSESSSQNKNAVLTITKYLERLSLLDPEPAAGSTQSEKKGNRTDLTRTPFTPVPLGLTS